MVPTQNRLILWTGPKHSGKTTRANCLIKTARSEGFVVAGILQPSIYDNNELVGFDVLDIQNQKRTPLTRRNKDKSTTGSFNFITDGIAFGNTVLGTEQTKIADLIIIDEFGPLELNGNGWRRNIDSLLHSSNSIILVVIRRELKDAFQQLYTGFSFLELEALEEKSIRDVIIILKNRSQSQ